MNILEASEISGSLTAVISLICDNLVNLITFSSILTSDNTKTGGTTGAPQDLVTIHLFVGALIGVIVGNVAVFIFTKKLSESGLIACIPIGIDAPTVFFMAFAVRGAFDTKLASGMTPNHALEEAWANGTSTIMIIGAVKLILAITYSCWPSFMDVSFDMKMFGACLLSIGVSLLGMNNILGIFIEPVSGITALFAFLIRTLPQSVRSGNEMEMKAPWKFIPHIGYSLFFGLPIYYLLAILPVSTGATIPKFTYGLPEVNYMGKFRCDNNADCQTSMLGAIPFAFLVFSGGYCVVMEALKNDLATPARSDNVETGSAITSQLIPSNTGNEVNDGEDDSDHSTTSTIEFVPTDTDRTTIRLILFIDVFCTILNTLCGGLVQTTPYIGYSTYRKLGVKKAYSLWFAGSLFVLVITGIMSYVSQALPQPVIKPIFILVALDLAQLALRTVMPDNKRKEQRFNGYLPGIIMALFPSMAHLMSINGNTNEVVTVLSNGFVITALLWGQVTLCITRCRSSDRIWAVGIFVVLAVFTNFGIIHSWNGEVHWNSWAQKSYLPTCIAAGYLLTAPICRILMKRDEEDEQV